MIIDSNTHCGLGTPWGSYSPEQILEIFGESIDYAIFSNFEGIESVYYKSELDCNLDAIRIANKHKKLLPLAVCQVDKALNNRTMRFLLTEYPQFLGLKFHPECEKLPANSQKYDKYLQLAEEFKKPCLFHSGHIKSKFSSPLLIYEKARRFPDVPIILGHLSTGQRDSHTEAVKIMIDSIENENATLYCDVSWLDSGTGDMTDIIMLIEALKNTSKGDYTNRILWASDTPIGEFSQTNERYRKNLDNFKVKIGSYFQDESLVNKLLYFNARDLYGL